MYQFFCHIWCFPYFFFTFDGFILILCSSNITCDNSFLTLGGSLTFLSHLTVPSSHYAVPISHLTVFLLHIVVPLFIYFFKFDSSIVILNSTNIASVLFLLHVTVLLLLHQVLYFLGIFIRSMCTEVSNDYVRHEYNHPN